MTTHSKACLTRAGAGGKIASATRLHFPPGKVLSCRSFDSGERTRRSECPVAWAALFKKSLNSFPRAPVEMSKQMPSPFLCVWSWGLGESEDGENGRTEPEGSGKLRWLAASAMAEGPRNRGTRRPEQWPQISATGAMFRADAGRNAGCKKVKPPN